MNGWDWKAIQGVEAVLQTWLLFFPSEGDIGGGFGDWILWSVPLRRRSF